MSTCRICGHYGEPLFKYGVRHYAHAACGFRKWGSEFLKKIPKHQVRALPYRAVRDAGLLDEVTRIAEAA